MKDHPPLLQGSKQLRDSRIGIRMHHRMLLIIRDHKCLHKLLLALILERRTMLDYGLGKCPSQPASHIAPYVIQRHAVAIIWGDGVVYRRLYVLKRVEKSPIKIEEYCLHALSIAF